MMIFAQGYQEGLFWAALTYGFVVYVLPFLLLIAVAVVLYKLEQRREREKFKKNQN